MTALRRFDLFSRSIFEIFEEYEHYKKERPNLIVDDHLLITYPFAIYLFANKLNAELASTIEAGLRTAYKSGEIQELLLKKLGKKPRAVLKNLNKRVRIDLPPFNISMKTLEATKQFTFNFDTLKN